MEIVEIAELVPGGAVRARIRTKTLVVTAAPPASVLVGVPLAFAFTAAGGGGPYAWSVVAGALPPGLDLASDGVLSGVPVAIGTYAFEVAVESGGTVDVAEVRVAVQAPSVAIDVLLRQLHGLSQELGPGEVASLDFLGNRNGRFDVGDFVALLDAQQGGQP